MPRIEKIRLVGIKYDSMRKQYEDSVLNLTNDSEPQHTLLTLMNGGGKGLLLQLLFQLLIPLTKWGSKGENRIEALFYNERKQFIPYTFHAVMEWRLDTDPVKWLMTGIAVTAQEKSGSGEADSDSAELRYVLYTQEYIKPSSYEVEDLPLYDVDARSSVSFEDWKQFMDKRKSDFTTYSNHQTKNYFELLKSYDIDRKEWETMRDINRQEGGVEAFFKTGQDNHSLFHHRIIPEISRHLASKDEEGKSQTLLQIFKHNALIAENLPKLLRREDSLRQLLQYLGPLKQGLETGIQHEDNRMKHLEEGNLIYHAMREWQGEQRKEKEKWAEEKQRTEQERKHALWQEDNLEYALKMSEQHELEQKVEGANFRRQQAEQDVIESAERETFEHAAVLWNERLQMLRRIGQMEDEMEMLKQSTEQKDMLEQLRRIEHDIKSELPNVTKSWDEILSIYADRLKSLERKKNNVIQDIDKLISSLRKLSETHGSVKAKIQTWNTEAMRMEQRLGRRVNEEPRIVLEQLDKKWEDAKLKRDSQMLEKLQLSSDKEELIQHKGKLSADHKHSEQHMLQLNDQWQQQMRHEEQMAQKLKDYLQLEDGPQTQADRSRWFHEIESKLAHYADGLEERFTKEQQAFWTHRLDASLAQHEYWIPNQDIANLKNELESQGLRVFYGSQFVQALSLDELEQHLADYPLLPYGLVMMESDWKKVNDTKTRSVIMRAPVPIFVREQMKTPLSREDGQGERIELNEGCFLLREAGINLVKDRQQWGVWQQDLQRKSEVLQEAVSLVKEQKEKGRKLQSELDSLLAGNSSIELQQEIGKIKEVITSLTEQMKHTDQQMLSIMKRIETAESLMEDEWKQIRQYDRDREDVGAWIKKCEEHRDQRDQSKALSSMIEEQTKQLHTCSIMEEELGKDILLLERTYLKWSDEQQRFFSEIKSEFPEFYYSFDPSRAASLQAVQVAETEEVSSLFTKVFTATLQQSFRNWKALNSTLEQNNAKLTRLSIELGYERRDLNKQEEQLERLLAQWRETDFAEEALDLVKNRWETARKQKMRVESELQECRMQLVKLDTENTAVARQVLELSRKIEKKHEKLAEPWENQSLESLEAEIRQRLVDTSQLLLEYNELLNRTDSILTELDKQMSILSAQGISQELVYEIPTPILQQVKSDPALPVSTWHKHNHALEQKRQQQHSEVMNQKDRFVHMIREQSWDTQLQTSLQQTIQEMRWDQYGYSLDLLKSIEDYAMRELEALTADKQKAENARDLWTERASYRVISIIKLLKMMTGRMTITNKLGHRFPLVKIETRHGDLPEKSDEVILVLKEYFVRSIKEMLEQHASIEQIPDHIVEERMNDSKIVLVALKNRYPILSVYKPQTTNVFLNESPKKHHYTEWETLNKGSLTEAKGSGGQLLAARTMIMMMLITYKRQQRQSKQWSVLISDNPFGQAVSTHILDPIFAIAEVLHFQWIVLAPPELIKLDVSRRFPVFWELELQRHKYGEKLVEQLQHGGRAFETQISLFD